MKDTPSKGWKDESSKLTKNSHLDCFVDLKKLNDLCSRNFTFWWRPAGSDPDCQSKLHVCAYIGATIYPCNYTIMEPQAPMMAASSSKEKSSLTLFTCFFMNFFCQLQGSRHKTIKKPFLFINSLLSLFCIYCCSPSYNGISKWEFWRSFIVFLSNRYSTHSH